MYKLKKSTAFLLLLLPVQLFVQSCDNNGNTIDPNCPTNELYADFCVCFDYNQLEVKQDAIEFYITDNSTLDISFENEWEAELAIEVIQHYKFDQYCTIGTDRSFQYFLTDGNIPEGEFLDEDCVPLKVSEMSVELIQPQGLYTLVLDGRRVYSSVFEADALKMLETLQHFQSNFGCYVGRPKTMMHYLRK